MLKDHQEHQISYFRKHHLTPQVTKMMDQAFKNGWKRSAILCLSRNRLPFPQMINRSERITEGDSAHSVMQSAKTMHEDAWLFFLGAEVSISLKRVVATPASQESKGRCSRVTKKLAKFSGKNASRDFYKSVEMPLASWLIIK